MPIVDTKQWLLDSLADPIEVTEKLVPYFKNTSAEPLYQYLVQCGMYVKGKQAGKALEQLADSDVWGSVGQLFRKYKKRWNGPDIPVFILPHRINGLFTRNHNKSGLAYPDKLILFISPSLGVDEIEALLIHEYHHVCRLEKQKKPMADFTILDTIILEGCAEYAVREIKGEEYLAPWTKKYSAEFLKRCWERFFKDNAATHNKDPLHEQLLYGKSRFPNMIGYCLGYRLMDIYSQKGEFQLNDTFTVKPEDVIGHAEEKL